MGKLKPLEVKLPELLSWLNESKVLYARDGRRSLYFTYTNNFEVEYDGKLECITVSPSVAISVFNDLPKD